MTMYLALTVVFTADDHHVMYKVRVVYDRLSSHYVVIILSRHRETSTFVRGTLGWDVYFREVQFLGDNP